MTSLHECACCHACLYTGFSIASLLSMLARPSPLPPRELLFQPFPTLPQLHWTLLCSKWRTALPYQTAPWYRPGHTVHQNCIERAMNVFVIIPIGVEHKIKKEQVSVMVTKASGWRGPISKETNDARSQVLNLDMGQFKQLLQVHLHVVMQASTSHAPNAAHSNFIRGATFWWLAPFNGKNTIFTIILWDNCSITALTTEGSNFSRHGKDVSRDLYIEPLWPVLGKVNASTLLENEWHRPITSPSKSWSRLSGGSLCQYELYHERRNENSRLNLPVPLLGV